MKMDFSLGSGLLRSINQLTVIVDLQMLSVSDEIAHGLESRYRMHNITGKGSHALFWVDPNNLDISINTHEM